MNCECKNCGVVGRGGDLLTTWQGCYTVAEREVNKKGMMTKYSNSDEYAAVLLEAMTLISEPAIRRVKA